MNKTVTVKYRLTPWEKAIRDNISQYLELSESQIDRALWQAESERIENGHLDNPVPDCGNVKHDPIPANQGQLRKVTISDWDDRGNSQEYYEHPDGNWLDVYNEKIVTAEHVREIIAAHERAILSYL